MTPVPPVPDRVDLVNEPGNPKAGFNLIFTVLLIIGTGVSAIMSLLPAIGREIGISDPLIATVQALSAVLVVLSATYWAKLSDRRGRKLVILVGCAGFALSTLVTAVAILFGMHHYLMPIAAFVGIMLGRAIFGLFGVSANTAAQAFVADRTSRADRTAALAWLASAHGFGAILGPAIAPFMMLPYLTLSTPVFAFGLLGCALTAVTGWMLPNDDPTRHDISGPSSPRPAPAVGMWRDGTIRPLLIYALGIGLCQFAHQMIVGFVVIDTLGMAPVPAQRYTGFVLMAGATAALLAQLGLIRWLRMTPAQLLRWGPVLAVVGNLLILVAPGYPGIIISFVVANIGYAFSRPGFMAGASLAVDADRQGEVAGALMAATSVGLIVAPVVAVSIYQIARPAPFVLNAVLMLALLLLALVHPALRPSAAP